MIFDTTFNSKWMRKEHHPKNRIKVVRGDVTYMHRIEVLKVSNENVATIKRTNTGVRVRFSGGNWRIGYNSKRPPINPHPNVRRPAALFKESITFELYPDGTIGRITGVKKRIENMLGKIKYKPEKLDEGKRDLEFNYGEAAVRFTLQNTFSLHPKGAVSIDQEWKSTSSKVSGIPYLLNKKTKFKTLKNGTITLETKAVAANNPQIKPRRTDDRTTKYYGVHGYRNTTIKIDHKTGLVLSTVTKQDINIRRDRWTTDPDNPERVQIKLTKTLTYKSEPAKLKSKPRKSK